MPHPLCGTDFTLAQAAGRGIREVHAASLNFSRLSIPRVCRPGQKRRPRVDPAADTHRECLLRRASSCGRWPDFGVCRKVRRGDGAEILNDLLRHGGKASSELPLSCRERATVIEPAKLCAPSERMYRMASAVQRSAGALGGSPMEPMCASCCRRRAGRHTLRLIGVADRRRGRRGGGYWSGAGRAGGVVEQALPVGRHHPVGARAGLPAGLIGRFRSPGSSSCRAGRVRRRSP